MFMPSSGSLAFGASFYGFGSNLFSGSGWNQIQYNLRLENMTDWTNISSIATPTTTGNVFEIQHNYGKICCSLESDAYIGLAWNRSANAYYNVPSAGYYSDPGPRIN